MSYKDTKRKNSFGNIFSGYWMIYLQFAPWLNLRWWTIFGHSSQVWYICLSNILHMNWPLNFQTVLTGQGHEWCKILIFFECSHHTGTEMQNMSIQPFWKAFDWKISFIKSYLIKKILEILLIYSMHDSDYKYFLNQKSFYNIKYSAKISFKEIW